MPPIDLPFVSVILPAKNEERYIKTTLESLLNQDYPANLIEIIVVDNNSTDSTSDICNQLKVKLIPFDRGPVGAVRNHGFKNSRGEYIFFLDSDCVAPVNWISNAINKLNKDQRLILGGGYCLRENPYFLEKYWLLSSKYGTALPKDLLGGSIAMHRSAFEEVAMFSEKVTSGEDTDLSKKLIEHKYHVSINDDMSVVHLGNPVTIKDFFSRQVWHSENYFKDIPASLRDPIFYLCVMALTFVIFAIFSAFLLKSIHLTIIFLLLLVLLPGILSLKRITRSGSYMHFLRIPAIYALDVIYLSGRSIGFLVGLKNKILGL